MENAPQWTILFFRNERKHWRRKTQKDALRLADYIVERRVLTTVNKAMPFSPFLTREFSADISRKKIVNQGSPAASVSTDHARVSSDADVSGCHIANNNDLPYSAGHGEVSHDADVSRDQIVNQGSLLAAVFTDLPRVSSDADVSGGYIVNNNDLPYSAGRGEVSLDADVSRDQIVNQ